MSHWILPVSGNAQSHTSVQHVTREDFVKPECKAAIDVFLADVKTRLNDKNFFLRQEPDNGWFYLDDETDDPAYPLAGEQPDYEDDFPNVVEDEEDAGIEC